MEAGARKRRQKARAQFVPTDAEDVPSTMSALSSARSAGDRSTYTATSRSLAVNAVHDSQVFHQRVVALRQWAGHATRLLVAQADESLLGEIPPQIREHLVQVAPSLQGWTEFLQTIDRLQSSTDPHDGNDQHPLRAAARGLKGRCLSERVQEALQTADGWERQDCAVLGRSTPEWFRMRDVLAPGSELSNAVSALDPGATQAQVLAQWAHKQWQSEDTTWFLREVIADDRQDRGRQQARQIARARKSALNKMAAAGEAYADITGHQVLTVVASADGTFQKVLPGGMLHTLSASETQTQVLIVPI